MTTEHTPSLPPPTSPGRPVEPYVGLRPYEERQHTLFFGREREAAVLTDRILGSPITVLHAPSGTGKTSLLRALVNPSLRKLKTRVVYFDDWASELVPAIRGEVAAGLKDVVSAERGASLLDLARALDGQTQEGLVVVCDQVEQLFLREPDQIDAFGQEIGALARLGPDAHVVLALREEYLGRLDVLRDRFLGVAQVKHRLQPLTGDAAREAIRGPLTVFKASIEPELVETLLVDLRDRSEQEGVESAPRGVEGISLPFLQIVCLHLWKATGGKAGHTILAEDYTRLGRTAGIVEKYVAETTEKLGERERLELARLLGKLAPRRGLKMSYPVDVLTKELGLPADRVNHLLDYLDERRIVRRREDTVELYHDKFTEVLRDFIDGAEKKSKIKQDHRKASIRGLLAFAAVALVVIAGAGGASYNKREELIKGLKGYDDALHGTDCAAMTGAIRDLWSDSDKPLGWFEQRVMEWSAKTYRDKVIEALQKNRANAEQCNAPVRVAEKPGGTEGTPIVLLYNEGGSPSSSSSPGERRRALQPEVVGEVWRRLAERHWEENRVPLPSTVTVMPSDEVPPGTFEIRIEDRIMGRRGLRQQGRVALLLWNAPDSIWQDVSPTVRAAIHHERRSVAGSDESVLSLGFADAWSTPLWQVFRERAQQHTEPTVKPFALDVLPGIEAAIAVEAFEAVAQQPELYVTPKLTRTLVSLLQDKNQARPSPCLVYAAMARQGRWEELLKIPDTKRMDVEWKKIVGQGLEVVHEAELELARRGRTVGVMTPILDRLADLPPGDPETKAVAVANWVVEDNGQGRPPRKIVLAGADPWKWECVESPIDVKDDWDRYSPAASTLLWEERPVIVRLGSPLIEQLTTGSASLLRPEVMSRLYQIRHELHAASGASMSGVSFRAAPWSDWQYRVDLLGARVTENKDVSQRGDPFDVIANDLRRTVAEARMALVTVDTTVVPWMADPRLMAWLQGRFSRNDIKLLLRGTLAPAGGADAREGGAPTHEGQDGRTIHHLEWLLGSLTFWAQICDARDGGCFVAGLQETQKARTSLAGNNAVPEIHSIRRGIEALGKNNPETATQSFRTAVQADRAGAQRAFVTAYAPLAGVSASAQIEKLCKVPPIDGQAWGRDDDGAQDDVDDALAMKSGTLDASRKAHLRLCALMYQLPTRNHKDDAARIRRHLVDDASGAEHWSAAEKYWLGYRLLNAQAHVRSVPRAERESTMRLLSEALSASKPHGGLDRAFKKLEDVCKDTKSDRCFWDLASFSEKLPLGIDRLWQFSDKLSGLETGQSASRLAQTQRWLARAAERTDEIKDPAQRRAWAVRFELRRMELDITLEMYGKKDSKAVLDDVRSKRAEIDSMPGLSPSDRKELAIWVRLVEKSALEVQGDFAGAWELVSDLRMRYSKEPGWNFEQSAVFSALGVGRVRDAAGLADAILEDPDRKIGTEDVLFKSAFLHLLLDDGDFDRSARRLLPWVDHQYRDYVRLMLWWRLVQHAGDDKGQIAAARRLLEDRKREIPAGETDKERFAEGELGPWRDWLFLYYLDPSEENRRRLYAPLVDQATFDASPLVDGGQSLSSFRTELFFYDALFQSVAAEPGSRKESCRKLLERAVAERSNITYEYHMARYLIDHDGCAPPGTR